MPAELLRTEAEYLSNKRMSKRRIQETAPMNQKRPQCSSIEMHVRRMRLNHNSGNDRGSLAELWFPYRRMPTQRLRVEPAFSLTEETLRSLRLSNHQMQEMRNTTLTNPCPKPLVHWLKLAKMDWNTWSKAWTDGAWPAERSSSTETNCQHIDFQSRVTRTQN